MEKFNQIQESFGTRLAECRRSKNFTQEELANRLGVTPQALSKWEKGLSSPDISMICSICSVLDISADYLLGTDAVKITEDGNAKTQERILHSLRNCLEPLKILIGAEVVPAFLDNRFVDNISLLRQKLATEGIMLPIVRIMDEQIIGAKEFYILAYENVLHKETLKEIREETVDYIVQKLEETVRAKYAQILNADMIKNLTDNLKKRFPALIESVVPEKISYGRLLDICKVFLNRGNSLLYLPKVIEEAERALREKPDSSTAELAEAVCSAIERPDNFWVQLNIKS